MTPTQIEELFFKTIEEKAVYNKLEGITENMIYNWRKGRGKKPSIGEMINVLYQLGKLFIMSSTDKRFIPPVSFSGEGILIDHNNSIEEYKNRMKL